MQVQWVEAEAPLSGLEEAVARLEAAEGVRGVAVGRQAAVTGHVSQELELWLGREHDGGKFDLVARSSNLVQVCAPCASRNLTNFSNRHPENSRDYSHFVDLCGNHWPTPPPCTCNSVAHRLTQCCFLDPIIFSKLSRLAAQGK